MSCTVPDQLDDLTRAARRVRECWAQDSPAGRLADAVCELSDVLDQIDAEYPDAEPIERHYVEQDARRDPLATPQGVIAFAVADRGATLADLLDNHETTP
jgi:hypothetical protein